MFSLSRRNGDAVHRGSVERKEKRKRKRKGERDRKSETEVVQRSERAWQEDRVKGVFRSEFLCQKVHGGFIRRGILKMKWATREKNIGMTNKRKCL